MKPYSIQSILILSGGLDSTVSSFIDVQESHPLLALTFDYGQRSAEKEIASAQKISKSLSVVHQVVVLPWLKDLTSTALVSRNLNLPLLKESELDDLSPCLESAKSVWVPNRNGLFLNVAAVFAESLRANRLVTGFNREEAATFPDNSGDFVKAANTFFSFSTQNKVEVVSHTLAMNKVDIAKKAKDLKISIEDLWFCYEGGEVPCRSCESCLRDFRAFRDAGLV